MDKRTFLALLLTALVIVLTPYLFPSARRTPPRVPATADSVRARLDTAHAAMPAAAATPPSSAVQAAPRVAAAGTPLRADTTTLRAAKATYAFTAQGAAPLSMNLVDYRSRRPADGPVTLESTRGALLVYRLVLGTDTVSLDTVPFTASTGRSPNGAPTLIYSGSVAGHALALTYTLPADSANRYLLQVRGTVANAPDRSALLIELPAGLRSQEADTADDLNHLAFVYKPVREQVSSVSFSKLDSTVVRTDSGPDKWIAVRNKYFLVALITPQGGFSALRMQGGSRIGKVTPAAVGVAVLPVQGSAFAFDMYTGPQEFDRLRSLGNDIDQVNPYAGWLHAVVQPFAVIVMRILLWMKRTLRVNYGWVLILFGVLIRLILWPLNQSAMRSSIKMQRIQPELAEIQKRYKTEPERQREAIMKAYQEHGMSPFSPMLGCLPMLLPMPILFALYFVFQNTIEFRGVSFLWLPDLALRDPFYITPIVMGASMFLLSWIGMRNVPPNPQSKMMAYVMPAMFTVMFLNFPSGLNLYYAVQNIAALPQQWIISKERAKSGPPRGGGRTGR